MPHAERSVTIDRPAMEVFECRADGTHNSQWRSGVVEIERTSAEQGQGASYRQVMTGPGGRRIDGDYKVTAYEPPRRLEFVVTAGPARPTGTFAFTENGGGSTTAARSARPLGPPP